MKRMRFGRRFRTSVVAAVSAALLAASLAMAGTVASGSAEAVLGDVNEDGLVTPADALLVHKHLATPTLTAGQQALADVDGDGMVTADDAEAMKRYYVRKLEVLEFAPVKLLPENGEESANPPYELEFAMEVTAVPDKEIRIRHVADDTVFDSFDATDPDKVSVNGNKVTLTPENLEPGTEYYIEIDQGAFADGRGNRFAGIAGSNGWNFVTHDPRIYVQAGAIGGDGSKNKPFGSLHAAINAADAGDTIVVKSGIYEVETSIQVDKDGLTIVGENGNDKPVFIVKAEIIGFMVSAANVIIDGLKITSDDPYAREFILVSGHNAIVKNNTIYGPDQSPPMDSWVVNRGIVTSVNNANVLIEGNTIYSVRTGAYINPGTTGEINNNVVYNTKDGFLVDRALVTFQGNTWGMPPDEPPNQFDIVLLNGTTWGPPYDDLATLSAENGNANINDQR